ncbi:MAG: hypothetical protein ACYCV7_01910, partial [Acidimicrobiales bacterium]
RRAGPPHPLLRALGPLLMGSTAVLMVSGVALWLAGPSSDLLLLRIHQVSFVLWLAFIAIHFVAHLLRAVRLAAADSRDTTSPRPVVKGARIRRRLVAASLVVGIGLGLLGRDVTTGWSRLTQPVRTPVPASTTVRPSTASSRPG